MAADSAARARLMDTVQFALDAADDAGLSDSYSVAPRVVDALFTDENFNDIIRVLGGKVAGLDTRMRVEWGSAVLFKQGGDLYER